LSTLD